MSFALLKESSVDLGKKVPDNICAALTELRFSGHHPISIHTTQTTIVCDLTMLNLPDLISKVKQGKVCLVSTWDGTY